MVSSDGLTLLPLSPQFNSSQQFKAVQQYSQNSHHSLDKGQAATRSKQLSPSNLDADQNMVAAIGQSSFWVHINSHVVDPWMPLGWLSLRQVGPVGFMH